MGHLVYFDWDHDVLFLHGWYALKLFTDIRDLWEADENLPEDVQALHANIKHIAIDVTIHWQLSFRLENLGAFPKLPTLTWVRSSIGSWRPYEDLVGHARGDEMYLCLVELEIRDAVNYFLEEKLQVENEAAITKVACVSEEEMEKMTDAVVCDSKAHRGIGQCAYNGLGLFVIDTC